MRKQFSFIRVYDAERDPDLDSIDQFIDDDVLNNAFRHKHCSRWGRKAIPFSVKFRMHILKNVKKIPSFNMLVREVRQRRAYREFCKITSKLRVPCAASLSNFRRELTFRDRLTLMSIFVRKSGERGFFDDCHDLHVIDSTDLISPCSTKVLGKDRSGREHYHDSTATKGKRSSKKGKSKYLVGHRKHTLSILTPNNKTIPLLSVVSPAHQHDTHFLLPLLHIASMMGLKVHYVVGDLGYIDTKRKKVARKRYGVVVHTGKKKNTKLPADVSNRGTPECMLGLSMRWLGYDLETGEHSYGCGLEDANSCMGCEVRTVRSEDYPVAFGEIPVHTKVARELSKKRKLIEPEFWRDKELYGLEKITLMNKDNVHFLSVVADICGLLKSLATFVKPCDYRVAKRSSFSSREVKQTSLVAAVA